MPRFDAGDLAAADRRPRRPAARRSRYDELRALPRVEQVSTFHCVTGWSVENVRWAGVRFDDLLAAARPQPAAGG